MNALLRKELRQVLPAQLFLTALFTLAWFVLVDPKMALAPYADGQSAFYALLGVFSLLEGLVLGLGQFGMERWLGTEAYLVHRGTGRRGAFRAKVLAGLASLAPLALVPPIVFGGFHLSTEDHAGGASVLSLAQAALAGFAVVPGYGLGAFVAQARRGWIVRAALGVLGALTFLIAFALPAEALGLLGRWPFAWHLSMAMVGAWLLFLAGRSFEAGDLPMGSRRVVLLHAVTAAALCMPFLFVVPYFVRAALRIDALAGLSHVVEDGQGRLLVATRTDRDREDLVAKYPGIPRVGPVYELVDAQGQRIVDEVGLHYLGLHFYSSRPAEAAVNPPTFTTLYAPFWTRLAQDPEIVRRTDRQRARGPFALSGPWRVVQDQPVGWHVLVDLSDGAVWVRAWSAVPRSWHRVATLGPSIRVLEGKRNGGPVLCDEATGLLRALRSQQVDQLPVLESAALPDGDRFVGVEPLYNAHAARIGVRDGALGELVRGTNGLYMRDRDGWLRWDEIEPSKRDGRAAETELDGLHRWTLVASPLDGTGFHLDVLDAATGETRLAVDLALTTGRQRNLARLADASCLAFSPAVVLASWSSPQRGAPETFGIIVPALLDELRGRNRTWVVLVSLLVAALLTRSLWRRLSQGGAPLELRLWWCGVTALLGLPAYVLCRLLEPRAARVPPAAVARERREAAASPLVEIVTA